MCSPLPELALQGGRFLSWDKGPPSVPEFQIGKEEVKISLLPDAMILYAENPRHATEKENLGEVINKLIKVA